MLYLAIPAQNEVATIGVLLWRLRTVLAEFPREYEVVVYDDASTDETADVADQYSEAMPVTVLRGKTPVGYAGAVDALVRYVSAATRYPRRDAMLLLQGDFTDPPGIVPEFARRFEGGADLVVGERTAVVDAPVPVKRLFSAAGWALRPFVRVDGVRDLTGSMRLARVSVLRDLLRATNDGPVCEGDTWTANADLLLRLVPHARRVESVPMEPTYGVRMRETRRVTVRDALASLRWGWRARGRRAVPTTAPESTADRNRGEPGRELREGLRDGRDVAARDNPRESSRDASRDSLRDASRDASREALDAPTGRGASRGRDTAREGVREGVREGARESAREGAGNGTRERAAGGARDEARTARPPRSGPKPERTPERTGEPRPKRTETVESLEESAARAMEREAARVARRDASREPKREGRREPKGPGGRGRVESDETLALNDPFAPPPRREDPLSILDRPLDDATRSPSGDTTPGRGSGGAVDDAESLDATGELEAEGIEGEGTTSERKRRRNRRSRRRRGGRDAAGLEGEGPDGEAGDAGDEGTSAIAGERDAANEGRDDGPREVRSGRERSDVGDVGLGSPDAEGEDTSDPLAALDEPLSGETESEARARRRGRRGRRGGARRSRGRGKRGESSDENGPTDGDDSPRDDGSSSNEPDSDNREVS